MILFPSKKGIIQGSREDPSATIVLYMAWFLQSSIAHISIVSLTAGRVSDQIGRSNLQRSALEADDDE
jgi:hypothetical protein